MTYGSEHFMQFGKTKSPPKGAFSIPYITLFLSHFPLRYRGR